MTAMGDWSLDPGLVAVLVSYLAAYVLLARRRARVRGRVEWARAASFGLGMGALVAALLSPLDALAEDGALAAHVAQHELLMNVAPVLLLLGLDAQLASPVTRALFGPVVRSARGRRVLRAASRPTIALGLYAGVMWAWSVPPVYRAVSASSLAHPLGHVLLASAGMIFWFHVIQPLPALRRLDFLEKLGYLLAGSLAGAAVAAALIGAPEALYGGTLAEQRLAGGLMMGVEMPLALGAGLWAVLRVIPRTRSDERWLST